MRIWTRVQINVCAALLLFQLPHPAPAATPAGPPPGHGKIEVLEFFWYECEHCNALQPKLKAWAARHEDDVDLVLVPVAFRPQYQSQQKLYYVLEETGNVDALHGAAFAYIHTEHRPLLSDRAVQAFAVTRGIDKDEFIRLYDADRVRNKVATADALRARFKIDGVPMLVVNRHTVTSLVLASEGEHPADEAAMLDLLLRRLDALVRGAKSTISANTTRSTMEAR